MSKWTLFVHSSIQRQPVHDKELANVWLAFRLSEPMRRFSLPLLLAFSAASVAAEIEEDKKKKPSKTDDLPEVVITATRSATPLSQVPAAVKTLDKKQMEAATYYFIIRRNTLHFVV